MAAPVRGSTASAAWRRLRGRIWGVDIGEAGYTSAAEGSRRRVGMVAEGREGRLGGADGRRYVWACGQKDSAGYIRWARACGVGARGDPRRRAYSCCSMPLADGVRRTTLRLGSL